MSNYTIINGELYHYGVPGMKWGVRQAEKYTTKSRMARESADEWDEMAKYVKSKGKLKKAANYRYWGEKDRIDARKYDKKAAEMNKATIRTQKAIEKYNKHFDKALDAQDAADEAYFKAKESYKKLGKTKITRVLAASRGQTDAAKQYLKDMNEAINLQEKADEKNIVQRRAYMDTGRNVVERVLNNLYYQKHIKKSE